LLGKKLSQHFFRFKTIFQGEPPVYNTIQLVYL